ncbi:MAG: 5-formyltetrahydrofolate cyclo-ligase [Planctomycetota bacterium]|nr:MAG: 5-formyltetrahydrofolate cyclo-ligase [Planctomycetota bacterium]
MRTATDKQRLRAVMRRRRAALVDRRDRSQAICRNAAGWLLSWLGSSGADARRPQLTADPLNDPSGAGMPADRPRHHRTGRHREDRTDEPLGPPAGDATTHRPPPVACFVGVRSEVDTSALLRWLCNRADLALAVPKTAGRSLQFWRIDDQDQLAPGRFGIPEPSETIVRQAARRVSVADCVAVFVPGLAFDPHGGRLGYGGGYFDRTLFEKPSAAPAVGLAFDCQVVARCPMEPHDVGVDLLITETRIIDCGAAKDTARNGPRRPRHNV